MQLRFLDIPKQFSSIDLNHSTSTPGSLPEEIITSLTINNKDGYGRVSDEYITVKFEFSFEFDSWHQIFSITEFGAFLKRIVEKRLGLSHWWQEEEDYFANGVAVVFMVKNENTRIDDTIIMLEPIVKEVVQDCLEELQRQARINSLVMFFDFPNEVKVYCEQYLLYFVQFLKDVGVEAIAEISEHAGSVLFSVTPQDRSQALSKIRQALDIYLQLPVVQELLPISETPDSIAVQRLVANVYHLKSSLALASATIQQQKQIINQKDDLINQHLLTGRVIIEAIRGEDKNNQTEDVIGDIVKVKQFDWQFIQIDVPALFRRIKILFANEKEQDKS